VSENSINKKSVYFTVFVAALGYFVDIYDLLLFGIVRVPSLRALGVPESEMLSVGVRLLNMQMTGLLLGGVLWGILGDKRGRKSVLFGSILLYSVCNIANAFVPNPTVYGWLRLLAGVGLAGELGAAITLVSEVMPQKSRGYGTAIVASVGILGAVVASLVGDFFSWQVAYIVGGTMGLALLALRAGLLESGMFKNLSQHVERGQFHKLLMTPAHLGRYLCCILIGVPIWYVIGILITFAPELSREMGVDGNITGSRSILWSYVGLSLGDLLAGLMSQWLESRKRAVLIFLLATLAMVLAYGNISRPSEVQFYVICAGLGLATGYWATFVTIGAEQFGTNIRATVATTVPNFVRGAVVPLTLAFRTLQEQMPLLQAAMWVGLVSLGLAFVALYFLKETFSKDLDYHESF
jgi:MFS family permease